MTAVYMNLIHSKFNMSLDLKTTVEIVNWVALMELCDLSEGRYRVLLIFKCLAHAGHLANI